MYEKKNKEFACKKQMFLDKGQLCMVYCEKFLTAIRPGKISHSFCFMGILRPRDLIL